MLPKPDLGHEYAQLGREVNKIHAVARAFPGLMRLFFQLPEWMMSGSKMFQIVKRLNHEVFRCTEEAFEEAVTKPDKQSINVMREIVDNSSLPPHEKELSRLKQEVSVYNRNIPAATCVLGILEMCADYSPGHHFCHGGNGNDSTHYRGDVLPYLE